MHKYIKQVKQNICSQLSNSGYIRNLAMRKIWKSGLIKLSIVKVSKELILFDERKYLCNSGKCSSRCK